MDADYTIREPANTLLTLRDDLVFTPQRFGDQPCYVVEDKLRSKFFRVGIREFTLISFFDGRNTIGAALGLAAAALGPEALSEHDGLAVCHWLIDCELAFTRESSQAARLCVSAQERSHKRALARLDPLMIKITLFNPDRALSALGRWFSWLYSWQFFLLWIACCLYGLGLVWSHRDALAASSTVVLDPGNWWRLTLAWLCLKLLHETSHGLVCKKYGGSVVRAGVAFILLAPVVFVDVTSAWRFRSKWQRIYTAAAGMYVELLAASLALIVWSNSQDGWIHHLAFNIVLMASVNTLVFNGNPLLRFDGYYILSDLLEVPNLYACGQQYLLFLVQRYLLGWSVVLPTWPTGRGTAIRVYAIAALAWRVLVCVTLSLALIGLFSYTGVALAILLNLLSFGLPAFRTTKMLYRASAGRRIDQRRLVFSGGIAVAIFSLLLFLLARPGLVEAPAVVEYSPLAIVRAASPGFVREMRVRAGEMVVADQVLAILENEELSAELADLTLQSEQSLVKSRIHYQNNDLAKYQMELANHDALEKKRAEAQGRVDLLTVRAPIAGHVVGRNLESLVGQYLETGKQIAIVGDESTKELVVAIPQEDVDLFTARLDDQIDVRVWGNIQKGFQSPLVKVNPRATANLPHTALSAAVGGPLAVKPKQLTRAPEATTGLTYELMYPRFTGTVALAREESIRLSAGQMATVWFRSPRQTAAGHFLGQINRWIDQKIAQSRAKQR